LHKKGHRIKHRSTVYEGVNGDASGVTIFIDALADEIWGELNKCDVGDIDCQYFQAATAIEDGGEKIYWNDFEGY
jgi:hypothetical protein